MADFIGEAARSVRSFGVPWVVVLDGEATEAQRAAILPKIEGASTVVWLDAHLGVAAARNIALSHVTTPFFRNLDADDVLLDDALDVDVEALRAGAVWSASGAVDVLDDGSRVQFPPTFPAGFVDAADRAFLASQGGYADIHYATLAGSVDHALAVGGYRAMRNGEDMLMVLALASRWRGHYSHEVTLAYRRWGGQTTADIPRNVVSANFRDKSAEALLRVFHPE